jgi:hypothetical protein
MLIDNLRAATSARLVAINVDDTLALVLSQRGQEGDEVTPDRGGEVEMRFVQHLPLR